MFGRNAVVKAGTSNTVIWALGAETDTALAVADALEEDVTVISVKFISPFDTELAERYRNFRHFTIEDHSVCGGLYSTLCEALAGKEHGKITPFGWPADSVIGHGKVSKLRSKYGLTVENIAAVVANS